jgi:general nucleoside transport system permease protein
MTPPPENAPSALPSEISRSIISGLHLGTWKSWLSGIGAILLSILIGSIFLLINGYSPIVAYQNILIGAFGDKYAIGETLLKTTPLLFTGLAVSIASQAGLFNIGAEGQLVTGALATAMIGALNLGLPPLLHITAALTAGFVVGALWGGLAGVIKMFFGAHEVIVTIMLNYIALLLTDYLVNYPWKAEGMVPQTNPIQPSAGLFHMIQGSQLSTGIFIGLGAVVVASLFLKKTIFGYEIRAVGLNPAASMTAGINTVGVGIVAMALAGAAAGVGGGIEVLGVHGRFIQGFSPGFGYDGIAVSVLANNQPWMVPITALLFGILRAGGTYLERSTAIPGDFSLLIQALVIFFAASPRLFSVLFKRKVAS